MSQLPGATARVPHTDITVPAQGQSQPNPAMTALLNARRTGAHGANGGQSPASQPQNVGVSAQAMRDDPMMVLIEAAYARSQATLDDLGGLAEEQKQSNSQMEKIRNVEKKLRDALTDNSLSTAELNEIEALAKEAGVWEAISSPVAALRDAIEKTPEKVNVWIDQNSTEAYHVDRRGWVDAIKESLKEFKENVKGQSANRELDMQRLTQEYSTASQMASNLSKRQNDTAMAIIRNLA